MNLKRLLKRERLLWHRHFIPSVLAGLAVALVSLIYQITVSNIVLFASVGASAAILTNTRSHHLTKLRTTILAYMVSIIISSMVYALNFFLPLHISVNIFLLVFLVGLFLFLLNVFHPPAITASLSFILLERPVFELIYLFFAIIILLIIVRLLTYTISQRLSLREFLKEFRKSF